MSILIKGMEMPENCVECRLNTMYGLPFACDGWCLAMSPTEPNKSLTMKTRPPHCPLVSVPPHGRLIDADELAGRLGITDMDCYKCAWGNHGFCSRGGDFTDACEAIEDAPTIIEAEGEE